MRSFGILGWSLGILLLVSVCGCEAPLVLDRVKLQASQITQRSDLLQAGAANAQTLVVVGSRGTVLSSTDSGASWARQVLPGNPFLMAVTTCPDQSFVALDFQRNLWLAEADAVQWRKQPVDTAETLQALACDPAGRLWVVGSYSSILHSEDGGTNWSLNTLDEDLLFTTIQFVDEKTAYLTGEFGVVVRSDDGGETWESLDPLPEEFYPQDAYFRDRDTGWVVGLTGTVMITTDAGISWERQLTATDAPLYNIGRNGNMLFVVGENGTVLKTVLADGNLATGRWDAVRHDEPVRFYLRAAVPVGDRQLLIAGGAGALYVIGTGT